MVDALLPQDGRWCTFTRTGLIQHRDPTIEEWLGGVQRLKDTDQAIRWNWGDLIILGEDNAEWGEMYAQALDESPYSYHTLTAYVRVCRAFPFDQRRADVDWTHYQLLAPKSLTPQFREQTLDAIEAGTIRTTSQTKEHVKVERGDGRKAADELPEPEPSVIYPPCPICKEPLQLKANRCQSCQSPVYEMAYKYRDLEADYTELFGIVTQFIRNGVVGPLKAFVSTYINTPDEQEAQ